MHEDVYPFGRKKVFIERYRDPREMIETTKGRNPPTGSYYSDEHDFIAQDMDLGGDEWRGGYSRSSDALHTFEHGTTDRKAIEEVNDFRLESTTTNTKKLAVRKPMVYGGAVNMGRYLTGNPQCMVAVRREKVKSKILELAFDSCVSAYVNADTIRIIGLAILGAISRLENTGYKVRIHAINAVKLNNGNVLGYDLLLKDSSDILSPTRIMFPLQDPAFERVITFGYQVRNPHWDDSYGMGTPIKHVVDDLDEFYKGTFGYDHVFSVQKLADLSGGMSKYERAQYIRDYLVRNLTE